MEPKEIISPNGNAPAKVSRNNSNVFINPSLREATTSKNILKPFLTMKWQRSLSAPLPNIFYVV
jgi:hypothetical protein